MLLVLLYSIFQYIKLIHFCTLRHKQEVTGYRVVLARTRYALFTSRGLPDGAKHQNHDALEGKLKAPESLEEQASILIFPNHESRHGLKMQVCIELLIKPILGLIAQGGSAIPFHLVHAILKNCNLL